MATLGDNSSSSSVLTVQISLFKASSADAMMFFELEGSVRKAHVTSHDYPRAPLNVTFSTPSFCFFVGFFFAEMSGRGEDISQVHWKQQWLENGTLYFHVSMTESEAVAQTTQASAREPVQITHEHMHLLHISVMVSSMSRSYYCDCLFFVLFFCGFFCCSC